LPCLLLQNKTAPKPNQIDAPLKIRSLNTSGQDKPKKSDFFDTDAPLKIRFFQKIGFLTGHQSG
jgi:hypothetical protein